MFDKISFVTAQRKMGLEGSEHAVVGSCSVLLTRSRVGGEICLGEVVESEGVERGAEWENGTGGRLNGIH